MKYVKTKDGHLLEIGKITEYGFVFMPECEKAVHFLEEGTEFVDVVKKADTIEELCDGWVLESKAYIAGFYVIYNTSENKKSLKRIRLEKDEKLFAFIKTEKGLTYVAKLNNKREFELL